ncbi:MAG: low molecular weight phosphatase family protein [Verrucomicrobia bacterium]|nr:low molecular weight phosphatase family protein [Verrucomicrobiota bacterium]
MHKQSLVLFICTGNYYRSRYAEALFNHRAQQLQLNWRAFSRGLAIHLADNMGGELSQDTRSRLTQQDIPLHLCGHRRVQLLETDLIRATKVIAMDKLEHLPMMELQFPHWADRAEYWNSRDLQWEECESCMTKIEQNVLALALSLGTCTDFQQLCDKAALA